MGEIKHISNKKNQTYFKLESNIFQIEIKTWLKTTHKETKAVPNWSWRKINKSETWKHYNLAQINRRLANMSLMTTPKHPTSLYQNKRNLERSPYFAMKNLPLGGCRVMDHLSPSSSSAYSSKRKKKILFFAIFIPLPLQTPIRASHL